MSSPPATIQYPAHVTFMNDALEFLGTSLNPAEPQAGRPTQVTNYYKVNKALESEWHLFVHIATPTANNQLQMIGNRDHEPVDGSYPVAQWKAGQVIADTWQLPLPANAPPQLALLLGFWHDNIRMQVDPPQPGEQARTDGQGQVLAAFFPLKVAGPPLPTYVVPRATGPITIDGKIDEAAWQSAPSTGPFVHSLTGGPTHTECTAKLLYDDQFLYVAFDVQDEDIWGTHMNHDDPIYGEEVVEIFIDADGDGKTYNEMEVSPHNVTFDAAFEARRSDLTKAMAWNSTMETAVQIQGTIDNPDDVDRGWTVEMKIPMKELYAVPRLPPQPGDVWRFNLYRLDYYNHRKVNEGQAFSPPMIGDFHNLARFAYLKFGS